MKNKSAFCLVDGHHGVYVPQVFANQCADGWRVHAELLQILRDGPNHEEYWDAWQMVLDLAFYTDTDGTELGLCVGGSGDLFAFDVDDPTLDLEELSQ